MSGQVLSGAAGADGAAVKARWIGLACVGLAAAVLFGAGLGSYGLWDTDEAKHAEIAREMLVSGALIEPTINFSPYHHKPSLLYLAIGCCFRLLGVNEFAARIVPALASLLTLLAVYWYTSSALVSGHPGGDPRAGGCAALLLASLAFFVAVGRYANFDAAVTAMTAMAALYFAWWSALPERAEHAPLPFYVAVALGVLVKGPVVLVLLALPVALTVLAGDVSWRELRIVRGAAIVAGLAGTWFVTAWLAHPGYITDFVWTHNLVRFFTARGTADMHPEAAWFFLPVLLIGLLPWSLLTGPALLWALRRRGPDRVLALYSLWVVVFFSMSSGKLALYVLPAFPTLAVLVARWLLTLPMRNGDSDGYAILVNIEAVLLALLLPAFMIFASERAPTLMGYSIALAPAALASAALLVVPRLRAATLLSRQLILALAMIAVSLSLNIWVAPAASGVASDKQLASIATALEEPAQVVGFHVLPHSFQFYTGWPITYHVSDEQYRAALSRGGSVVVVTKEKWLDALRELVPQRDFRELARTPRHLLLVGVDRDAYN